MSRFKNMLKALRFPSEIYEILCDMENVEIQGKAEVVKVHKGFGTGSSAKNYLGFKGVLLHNSFYPGHSKLAKQLQASGEDYHEPLRWTVDMLNLRLYRTDKGVYVFVERKASPEVESFRGTISIGSYNSLIIWENADIFEDEKQVVDHIFKKATDQRDLQVQDWRHRETDDVDFMLYGGFRDSKDTIKDIKADYASVLSVWENNKKFKVLLLDDGSKPYYDFLVGLSRNDNRFSSGMQVFERLRQEKIKALKHAVDAQVAVIENSDTEWI